MPPDDGNHCNTVQYMYFHLLIMSPCVLDIYSSIKWAKLLNPLYVSYSVLLKLCIYGGACGAGIFFVFVALPFINFCFPHHGPPLQTSVPLLPASMGPLASTA